MIKSFLLFFLNPIFLFCAYVGNPCSPALMQTGLFSVHNHFINVTSGYLADFVFDKKIKPDDKPEFVNLDKVKEFEMHSNMASLSLIFLRRMEIYSYLGVSKETMDWKNKIDQGNPTEIKTKNHFSYGIGSKFILLQFPYSGVGLDVQYFSLPSSDKVLQKLKNIYIPLEVDSQYLKIKEWHIALGCGLKLAALSPYFGVKYLKYRVDVKTEGKDLPTIKFKNCNSFGVFTGISLNLSNSFYLNAEARFIDEFAVAGAAVASF